MMFNTINHSLSYIPYPLNTLKAIRQHVYACFERSRDALMKLLAALGSESAARSMPELSLSPLFQRTWPSVYISF